MTLVIFDCDGVLVDSEAIENDVLAKCLSQIGWPMDGNQARDRFLGFSMSAVIEQIIAHLESPLPQNWLSNFHTLSRARLANEVTAVHGVIDALDRIEAMGFQTGVASSGEHAKMAITLGRVGLYQRFAGRIFSADDVAAGKPSPDVYLLAAKTLGYGPSNCIAIEDSPNGVRAGVAAGMVVFGYGEQIEPERLLEAGAVHVFNDMTLLPKMLADYR